MTRPLVLYHARCPDGMASAWVVHTLFAEKGVTDAEFVPVDYGSPPPTDLRGRALIAVDYCPPADHLELMLRECATIIVVDHHKTAAPTVAAFENRSHGLQFEFDLEHSGSFLTWRHFFPDRSPPPLVLYTEDRDLWAWKLPFSKEVSAYLSSLPWGAFGKWTAANQLLASQAVDVYHPAVNYGMVVLEAQERMIEDHMRAAFLTELCGHQVWAVNCTSAPINSELVGRLAAGRPFAASWFVRPDGKAQVSLRSRGATGIDVSEVAKTFPGGGGHTQAAGFQVPASQLPFTVPLAAKTVDAAPGGAT